jgi:hypothetical protein
MKFLLWLVLLAIALPGTASAVAWKNALRTSETVTSLTAGGKATWTSTASGEDSSTLECSNGCVCDNTHATTSITVYRATFSGTKLTGDFWKLPAATNCSDATLDQCSTGTFPIGTYIFDADTSAAATAQCSAVRVE